MTNISPLQPITVTQLNRYVRALLEESENLRIVCVAGEISNFKPYTSGHWYFTLKDESSAVPAVMFREANQRLQFLPQNGMRVLIRGHASLFERDGKFQLYIDDMQPDGLGALYMAFEQLKERLAAEGLFDSARKKPLPAYPQRIGVITSQSGAAVQDILNILARRFPIAEVILCPVLVQGEGAAQQIAAALALFNKKLVADVLIVGRGGGSLEDLWAFNDEIVARAVSDSQIPVISAVGHETDITICDFAADLRAPTPSAAAELVVPERAAILVQLANFQQYLRTIMVRNLQKKRENLDFLLQRRVLREPLGLIAASRQRMDVTHQRIQEAMKGNIFAQQSRLAHAAARLDAMSPLKVLSRGYALALKSGNSVTNVAQIDLGDQLQLRFCDGSCQVIVWGIES